MTSWDETGLNLPNTWT